MKRDEEQNRKREHIRAENLDNTEEAEVERDFTMVENVEPSENGVSYFTVDHEIDEIRLKDTQEFYETIEKLNKTYEVILSTDRTVKQSEELKRYNRALNKLGDRVGEIDIPEEYKGKSEETENIRNITFVENRGNVEDALNSTVDALDQLDRIELKNLPSEYLVKLVHILVTLCRQGNVQIQSDISLIAQLDRDAFDFINAHEKLEAAKKFNVVIQGEVKFYRSEQKKHTKMIDDLQGRQK